MFEFDIPYASTEKIPIFRRLISYWSPELRNFFRNFAKLTKSLFLSISRHQSHFPFVLFCAFPSAIPKKNTSYCLRRTVLTASISKIITDPIQQLQYWNGRTACQTSAKQQNSICESIESRRHNHTGTLSKHARQGSDNHGLLN